jgi:uncharacterized membrane protein
MSRSNKQLILAFFDNEAAADSAVEALKSWDKATDSIKLGAIGILVKDENGKIKQHKLGQRAHGKGAGIGIVLGLVAAVLSGGVTLLGGLVGGTALGGIMGAFFHKGLGMSKDDMARIGGELDGGKAAVGVLANVDEAGEVTDKLQALGGKAEAHEVSEEALQHADHAAAEEAPAAEEAAPVAEAPAVAEAAAPAEPAAAA